ncbi:TPA: hypothetical protein DDW35_13590 [Candidatus Sumerlaeota bacterium]|nr:hypothetical protein [Candidatus Sumerlaeota bacterium]
MTHAAMALPVSSHTLATILSGNTAGAGNSFSLVPPPAHLPTQRVSLLPSFMRRLSAGASDVLRRFSGAIDTAQSLTESAESFAAVEVVKVAKVENVDTAPESMALSVSAARPVVLREACLFEGCCTLQEKCKRKVCLGGC